MSKKIVQINSVCYGSTGKIMCDIASKLQNEDFESYCFFGRGNPNAELKCIKIGNKLSFYFHVLIARFGFNGYGSYFSTKKMIRKLKKINPDIIHLHNIHGYYLNFNLLFNFLKNKYKGRIIWTLHDCWAFTGHCPHFTIAKCNKWKTECSNCPQLSIYPRTFFDNTKREHRLKKKLFLELPNLTIVTPSVWLKDLVKQSFFKNCNVQVINNGVDLNVFKPTYDKNIYDKYDIPKNKKVLLGVANVWEKRKGLNTFLELSKIIQSDTIIVLVGLTKKQIKLLPDNIIGIEQTDNIYDLVKIYSISNVFLNPSLEETFSLVTIEAMACGTPVVVSKTSAIKNLVVPGVGEVVDQEKTQNYFDKICNLSFDEKKINKHIQKYSNELNIKNYLNLYKE